MGRLGGVARRGGVDVTPTISPAKTRVLLALYRRQSLHGSASIGGVAADLGIAKSTAQVHLKRLEHLGLVASEPGRHGTLRALVEVVCAPYHTFERAPTGRYPQEACGTVGSGTAAEGCSPRRPGVPDEPQPLEEGVIGMSDATTPTDSAASAVIR